MASTSSDKCRWESKYGGGFITDAQYLAECMCARMAEKDSRGLPVRFWESGSWKRAFLLQVRNANSLLKVYSCIAIIRALKTKKGKSCYSLGAKFLIPMIELEQEKIHVLEKAAALTKDESPKPVIQPAKPEHPRPVFSRKKTTLGRLKDLDGEESGETED